ncbi:MAG: FkbM family methyltransferase [Casimicrobiaceae bacterium]
MITYAQNFEDVILARAFGDCRDGFYVDVGACFPDVASVTRHFYERGWSGINVEPMNEPYQRLSRDRPRDLNIRAAIGGYTGEIAIFPGPSIGESSALRRDAGAQAIMVPCLTLAELCTLHVTRTIDFLKVDVEGLELDVIRGGDWTNHRPRVVVIEVSRPWSRERRPDAAIIDTFLREQGYSEVYYDGLNAFYVANEAASLALLLACPPNVLDHFETLREAQFDQLSATAILNAERAEAAVRHAEGVSGQLQEALAGWRAAQSLAEEHRLRAERVSANFHATRPQIEDAVQKVAELERQLNEVSTAWRAVQTLADENASRGERLTAQLDGLKKELEVAIRWAESAVTDLTRRLHEAHLRAGNAEARTRHAEACFASIEASNSWRVMAPLRMARSAIRRLTRALEISNLAELAKDFGPRLVRRALRLGKRSRAYAYVAPTLRRRFPSFWFRAKRTLEKAATFRSVGGELSIRPSTELRSPAEPAAHTEILESSYQRLRDIGELSPQLLAEMIKREAARQRKH